MRLAPVAIAAAIILSLTVIAHADPYSPYGAWTNVITDHATDHSPGNQYGLRDVTLSPDENWIYGAWQHGDGIRWLYRYDANSAVLDTAATPNYSGSFTLNHVADTANPTFGDDNNTNWQSVIQVGNYVYGGADVTNAAALTTPGAGGYYGGFQGLVVLPSTFGANNTPATDTINTSSLGGGIGGLAASGNYLYATLKSPTDGIMVRYNISNPAAPVFDKSWSFSTDLSVGTDYFHGLIALPDGAGGTDLYITSGDQTDNSRPAGALYRVDISSTGTMTLLSTLTMPNRPQDIALYNNTLYVTEWVGASSQIAKVGFAGSTLQDEGLLAGPPHPFDGGDAFRNANGGGYSGITITKAGNILIGDQYWNDSGTPGTENELLTDRIYESTPVPEPGTIALFGLGVPVLVGALRRKRRSA